MAIKKGDIVACKNKGSLISEVIETITHSNYSHIAVYVGGGLLIEADGISDRIRYRPMSDYKGHLDIFTCDKLTDVQRENIVKYMQNSIGEKYDYALLAWLFVKYVFGILLPFIDNSKNKICSEIANDAYDSVEYRLCADKWPTPEQIVESKLLVKCGEY